MNKKFIWIFAVILIIIVSGVFYFLYKEQSLQVNIQNNTTYPQTSNFAFYPIHEIKLNKFISGTYNTEGYVVKIYTCPPCPKGAQCKPCMRDNIVISENNKLLETYSLSDKEIILFSDNPNQFDLGKKYKFSIKILDYKSTGESINDIEIIGYNSLGNETANTNSDANIITNKSNYSKGEIVKIVIQNNTDLEKNILSPFYIIERFDKEGWIEIKKILCPCNAKCKLAAFLRLDPKKTMDFEWSQKEERCTDKKIPLSETISEQVPSGTYRIKVEIVNSGETYPYQSKETIYSERFLIN